MFIRMKLRKILTFIIIILLVMEFNFIIFTSLLSFPLNNTNSREIAGEPANNFGISNSPENIFEIYSNYTPDFAPLSIVTLVGEGDPDSMRILPI